MNLTAEGIRSSEYKWEVTEERVKALKHGAGMLERYELGTENHKVLRAMLEEIK